MSKIQMRGNCQCCGRQQAVQRGYIAKHGYTVDNGYFNGVCVGNQYPPLQVARDTADNVVANCRKDAAKALADKADFESGVQVPGMVKNPSGLRSKREAEPMVAFADLDAYDQKRVLHMMCWNLGNRAKAAADYADMLEGLANTLHGTALIEVNVDANKAERVRPGAQKLSPSNKVLTAKWQDGARVVYTYQSGDKSFQTWMGAQSWRRLDDVPA